MKAARVYKDFRCPGCGDVPAGHYDKITGRIQVPSVNAIALCQRCGKFHNVGPNGSRELSPDEVRTYVVESKHSVLMQAEHDRIVADMWG